MGSAGCSARQRCMEVGVKAVICFLSLVDSCAEYFA